MTTPTTLKRSFIYRQLNSLGAENVVLQNAEVANHFNTDTDSDAVQLQHIGLIDFSCLPRIGVRGQEAESWLKKKGLDVPAIPNKNVIQKEGANLIRLSKTEFLFLDALNFSDVNSQEIEAELLSDNEVDCITLPRQDTHGCFYLTGEKAAYALSKLCAVDFRTRSFSSGNVAQTILANINAVIVRCDYNFIYTSLIGYLILFDSSYSEYLWESMLDAMDEFNGKPLGVRALS